ncbi:S1C family serine protease [Catalinimonas niigatensis]|uniref:S1C family serine protease n=1 Tax=Catalinimonas niigatensis TaxID=1397264 RepID=UPI0026656CA1|nr:trypsin-like peptidase domain-containing protein [Catalinimonas niigatensis]WPP52641.1 trypsin-like peptidase domain-containing protein [Catalinimonas niigatensis]
MKNTFVATLLSMPILFTNCASILNSKYQQVMVNTDSQNTKVYVDHQYVGKGNQVMTPMERDLKVREVKVEREGYKPEHHVHFQQKKSPLYILSWVPFGILLYPPLYDVGPKSFNYDKVMTANTETKVTERADGQKYIYLQKTAFNIAQDNLIVKIYSHKKYVNNKQSSKTEYNTENIELDNSIFTDKLNVLLKEYGYIDTVNTILKDKTNTMYISAQVKQVTLNGVRPFSRSASHYLVAETSIDWQILDVYNIPKFSSTIASKSGEFSDASYKEDGYSKAAIEDAITSSLIAFLGKKEVQELLKKEDPANMLMPEIAVTRPVHGPKSLSEAQAATVTISHTNGHGSGFLISEDGYIITNFHVVAGQDDLKVIMNDGQEAKAEFIRANEYADLALIKINAKVTHAFQLNSQKNYESGDEVFAIGTPTSLELGQTLSKGIVSGIRKQKDHELIQTDVSVNPGNSGGALVNEKGELVGVVNSKVIGLGIEGIAFCTPSKDIFELLSISTSGKISLK